jgi:NAD(P)-dependent dehydrogenase (short-subunit alcohol dehydrogenase family)
MNNEPVALVTGASRGIGRAIALALAGAGFRVAGVGRPADEGAVDASALNAVQQDIQARSGIFLPIPADVADLDGHAALVEHVLSAFGRLDVFVANAGVAPSPRRDVLEMTPASYDRVMDVNLRGHVFLAQRVARAMLGHPARTVGTPRSLIFITSVSADTSSVDRAEYCISKAGLSMTARVLAHRLAGEGIAVYEVRPGIVHTDMTAAVGDKYDRAIGDGLVPEGRWGEPADVARVVLALARGDLPYATGSVVDVSGGLQLKRL